MIDLPRCNSNLKFSNLTTKILAFQWFSAIIIVSRQVHSIVVLQLQSLHPFSERQFWGSAICDVTKGTSSCPWLFTPSAWCFICPSAPVLSCWLLYLECFFPGQRLKIRVKMWKGKIVASLPLFFMQPQLVKRCRWRRGHMISTSFIPCGRRQTDRQTDLVCVRVSSNEWVSE